MFLILLGTGAATGASAALLAAGLDPGHFNFLDPAGMKHLLTMAANGAIGGVVALLLRLPRNPDNFTDRATDKTQIEKAATKLVEQGEIPPIVPKP